MLVERIDNRRCAREIQENLKHDLQIISEHDLRGIFFLFLLIFFSIEQEKNRNQFVYQCKSIRKSSS